MVKDQSCHLHPNSGLSALRKNTNGKRQKDLPQNWECIVFLLLDDHFLLLHFMTPKVKPLEYKIGQQVIRVGVNGLYNLPFAHLLQ